MHDTVTKGDILGREGAGPIHTLAGAGIHGGFQQTRFDQNLLGFGIQTRD